MPVASVVASEEVVQEGWQPRRQADRVVSAQLTANRVAVNNILVAQAQYTCLLDLLCLF